MILQHALECGQRLQDARKASGFTMSELARRARVTRDVWNEMEHGTGWMRCGIKRMECLARAVNLSFGQLVPPECLTKFSPYPPNNES